MKRAVLVREKISAVISMLVRRNIRVTQRGSEAYTRYNAHSGDIELINIPYIPDDADQFFLDAIEGYVDHEVGHVLFSDASVAKKAKASGLLGMFNLVEDTFIEREMTAMFNGSGMNLSNVSSFFLQNYTDKAIKKGGEDAIAATMVPAIRALAGQAVHRDYMEDKWHIVEEQIEKIGDYLKDELPKIKSSADSLRVAKKAVELLEREEELGDDGEDQPENKKKSGDNQKSNSNGKKGQEDKEKGSESEEGDESDESDESDDQEDGESYGGDGDSEDQNESDDESYDDGKYEDDHGSSKSSKDDGSEEESEDREDDSSEDEKPEESKPGKSNKGGKPKSGIARSSELNGFDGKLSEAISEMSAAAAKRSGYVVWTTDFDKIEKINPSRFDESAVNMMQDRVDHMVAPLQKDLERAIAARSKAVWTSGHRSGRINASALARLTTFKDDRAFRRKQENLTNDVAVTLLMDCSGSMSGEKIETAADATYALASVLERIKIPTEVLGFTTLEKEFMDEARREEAKTGVKYARFEALNIPIVKEFSERMTPTVKNRIAFIRNSSSGSRLLRHNVDGESLQIAVTRLAKRNEKRKIVMVLSDGAPACGYDRGYLAPHLHEVVKDAKKSGVEIVGIGIKTSEPKKYYPKCVVLNKVSDLPETVIREIKNLLLQL